MERDNVKYVNKQKTIT